MSSAGKATGEERRGEEGRGEEGSQVVSEDGGFQGQIGQGLLGSLGMPAIPGLDTQPREMIWSSKSQTTHTTAH